MKNQKSTYSWTAVVIMLILFWPVGIFMLIGKLANDRSANFGGGAGIVKLMGMALVGLGVLVFIVAVTDPELMSGGIISLVVFGLPGLWLLKRSKRMKSTGIRNRGYINYIVNNQVHDIHEVARRMGVSQEVVVKEVNEMINHGMLGRARLNLNTGKIEFPRPQPRPQTHQTPRPQTAQRRPEGYQNRPSTPHRDVRNNGNVPHPQSRPAPEPVKMFSPKTIRCTSCSANNFVENLPAQCEYCGTSLHE